MGHPGLLIQDYVAGIPIWYNPNNNRAKGVTIVNTLLLCESTSNETSLVLLNGTIQTVLGFEDPFAANNICSMWPRNQCPHIGLREGRKLLRHHGAPGVRI
jgi:hypothetical protein